MTTTTLRRLRQGAPNSRALCCLRDLKGKKGELVSMRSSKIEIGY